MSELRTKKSALVFGGPEAASAHELAAELARLGCELELWQLGDEDRLNQRLADQDGSLHALLLGLGAGTLAAGWMRRFLLAAEAPSAALWPTGGWVCFAEVEPPADLAAWPRFRCFGQDTEVFPLLEHLEPRASLLAALGESRRRWWASRDSLRRSPRRQNWPLLWNELAELLARSLELRYRLELRRRADEIRPPMLAAFPGFKSGDRDLTRPDWAWHKELSSLAVHDLRNELAVLPLLAERAEDPDETIDLAPRFGKTLARLEASFDRLFDLLD